MENAPRYKVGDLVSVAKWDATERPEVRIGSPAKVIGIDQCQCESGFLLALQGSNYGAKIQLDQGWVTPWVSPMEGGHP